MRDTCAIDNGRIRAGRYQSKGLTTPLSETAQPKSLKTTPGFSRPKCRRLATIQLLFRGVSLPLGAHNSLASWFRDDHTFIDVHLPDDFFFDWLLKQLPFSYSPASIGDFSAKSLPLSVA